MTMTTAEFGLFLCSCILLLLLTMMMMLLIDYEDQYVSLSSTSGVVSAANNGSVTPSSFV